MSELKARHIVDVYDSYYAENPFGERSQVYLKSEADAELRHQKYKRCLAMARWCITEAKVSDDEYRMYWWVEWHKRWMKLAEKFKEKK